MGVVGDYNVKLTIWNKRLQYIKLVFIFVLSGFEMSFMWQHNIIILEPKDLGPVCTVQIAPKQGALNSKF